MPDNPRRQTNPTPASPIAFTTCHNPSKDKDLSKLGCAFTCKPTWCPGAKRTQRPNRPAGAQEPADARPIGLRAGLYSPVSEIRGPSDAAHL